MVDQYILSLKLLPLAGFDVLVVMQESVVVNGVIRTSIEPNGRPSRIAVRVILLQVSFARRVEAVVVRHDVGKRIVPDHHVVRTASNEDPSVGTKVVRAVCHIFKGVVSKGEIENGLVEGLPTVPTFSISLDPTTPEDAPRRS